MQLGLVVGTATATRKHATLVGAKLLVVQPLLVDGRSADGEPLLAVDRLGAGHGETVIITSDGRFTRELLKSDNTPVRWSVIGLKND
jgi:ethanolamine utilization protein EutN